MPASSPIDAARRALLAALTCAIAAPAHGQAGKPLRLIVPFTPGGSTDILARALAPRLAAALGVNVLVDNKPGAGGSLGAAEAALTTSTFGTRATQATGAKLLSGS